MKQEAVPSVRNVLFAVVLFGLVPAAYGATLYAANNGVDFPGCGPTASPCRSITRAIANAAAGDTIQVRPGQYGDLNGNGVPGESGEETPSPGCGCMLSVNKSVTLISTDGAAATIIDATTVPVDKNVLIIANDAEFGRPEHGFHVTNPRDFGKDGIVIDGTDVKIRGNLVVKNKDQRTGIGIWAVDNPSNIVLIEQNHSIGWGIGIRVFDAGKKVSKNQVSLNGAGIKAEDASVVGNVSVANFANGIFLVGAASAVGNASYGNSYGFFVQDSFTGVIQKNNIFGNLTCGLGTDGVAGVVATGNYWGASTGPGFNPADAVCNTNGGTTITTPFATTRFAINPTFEP